MGWKREPQRHCMARKGIKSNTKKYDDIYETADHICNKCGEPIYENIYRRGGFEYHEECKPNSKGIEEIPKNILDIIAKYEKKDYWDDEIVIKNKIEEWELAGNPKPFTPETIRTTLMDYLKSERKVWVTRMINKIKSKDQLYLNSTLKHDQKFTKEIFTAITGIETKGKSTKDLKVIINKYVEG